MTMPPSAPLPLHALVGARVFDGSRLHEGSALLVDETGVHALMPEAAVDVGVERVRLNGGILVPGFLDVQVNGGGGALLGQGDPDLALATICATHLRLGSTGILPTLITSDTATTQNVIEAALRAASMGVPGFLGLHLEGPHLDPRRKGAHDASLIRPMTSQDIDHYLTAAQSLPVLMITLAPEAVRLDQVRVLADAGIIVSLGHSDCTDTEAYRAFEAGARMVTHLYNAMSPLQHRAPGLVGAALDHDVFAGIIPDGVHVARTAVRVAAAAKHSRLIAVTDAMSVAGTDLPGLRLNDRDIFRKNGRLTLEDGTLAGADISMPAALRWMTEGAGVPLELALRTATQAPAELLGLHTRGHLNAGARADMVHLDDDMTLRAVWHNGRQILQV